MHNLCQCKEEIISVSFCPICNGVKYACNKDNINKLNELRIILETLCTEYKDYRPDNMSLGMVLAFEDALEQLKMH